MPLMPPPKRIIKTNNKIIRFIPAVEQLLHTTEAKHFNGIDDARAYLQKLKSDETQLKGMADDLKLDLAASAKPADLTQAIADALACGKIAVIEETIASATPPSPLETLVAAGGADARANLGPHENSDLICQLLTLLLKCSHSKRSYQLDAINDPPNLNGVDKVIQVIAKPGEPDKIAITFAGQCDHGNEQCPGINITGDDGTEQSNKSPHILKALPKKEQTNVTSFMDFIKHYLVPDLKGLKYQTYTVTNTGCNGVPLHTAKVQAFPSFKWGGDVSFGYAQSDGSTRKNINNLTDKADWKLSAKLEGNIADKNWTFESSDKNEADQYFPKIQDTVSNFVNYINDVALNADKNKGLVKFDMTWPSVSLGGNIELKENNNTDEVSLGGEINFKMAPLVKADVRTDLLEWLILAAGPYAVFLQKIKTKAANDGIGTTNINAKAVIAIELIVVGEVKAALTWTKNAQDKWLTTEGDKAGEIGAGVTVGLEAKIKVETKIFYVKITMGSELHVKGATSTAEGIGIFTSLYATTEKDKPAFGGSVKFTGAAIYYTYYAEVGSKGTKSDDGKNEKGNRLRNARLGGDATDSNADSKLKEDRMKKLVEIFKPNEWPKHGAKTITINKIQT